MYVYNNHSCISDYLEFNTEFIELIKEVQLSIFSKLLYNYTCENTDLKLFKLANI